MCCRRWRSLGASGSRLAADSTDSRVHNSLTIADPSRIYSHAIVETLGAACHRRAKSAHREPEGPLLLAPRLAHHDSLRVYLPYQPVIYLERTSEYRIKMSKQKAARQLLQARTIGSSQSTNNNRSEVRVIPAIVYSWAHWQRL